jgi:hypothetical protein
MKIKILTGAALTALLVHSPAYADRTPSVQIRCDGMPDNVTAGETAARLIGAVTLLGLFAPQHETADSSLRLSGAEGIAICGEALTQESNDVRRAQLILAGAIHRLEAGSYDAAIVEARRAETDRPALAASAPFRRSLHLTALEIEALALIGLGRIDDAVAKALEMADAAPYDVTNQLRAARFVRLSGRFGPAEQRFFDNLVRLYPGGVLDRATQRQMAGDFRGAAEDYELWMRVERTMIDHADMVSLSQAAMTWALAGDTVRAENFARQAREAVQAEPTSTGVAPATEILDLYNIWKNAHDGRIADARLLFGSRSNWLAPAPPAVSEVARLLHEGAGPAEATGLLAGDPARFRAEFIERRRHELAEPKDRFTTMRGFYTQGNYDHLAANVWREGRSRYFNQHDDERVKARAISVALDGDGIPAGYALLLHSALRARAEGKSAFMILPVQTSTTAAMVRFGNPGEENIIEPMSFDAARVIADLTPVMPRPAAR